MKENSLKFFAVGGRSLALWLGLFALLATASLQLSTFAQGTAFTYQGRLNDGNSPANGNYDIRFYLRNAASGGSPVGTTNTIAPVQASNGLFTVTLDFGPGIFTGSPLWLEIGVRTNGSVVAYTTLSPRQPLTPSPYALFSPQAGSVTNGAITSAMLANAAVTSAKLADGAVTSQQLADAISLGSASVNGQLDIYHTTAGGPAISLLGAANQLSIYGESDNLEKVRLLDASGLGELLLYNNFGSAQGAVLLANFLNGGGLLILNGTNGQNRAVFDGGSGGGSMRLYNVSSANTVSLNSTGNSWLSAGNLGIGTTAPSSPLHIVGFQGTALFETTGSGNGAVLQLKTDLTSPTYVGAINFLDHLNNVPGQILYRGSDTMDFSVGSTRAMTMDAFHELLLYNASGVSDILLNPGGGSGGDINLSANGNVRLQLIGSTTTGGSAYFSRPSDGSTTISLVADDGTGSGLITTSVLQITGGADLSEQFDVRDALNSQSSTHASIQPGMVVSIDPDNPGQLVVSTKPYDRTVAGIVSGAGGVNPGMLMGHHGTVADGKHPVALTGRVYCLADASSGPIQPGDLLTTATTAGHAMKASDPVRAQGAILGKAMSRLQKGEGLVLVLITLQ